MKAWPALALLAIFVISCGKGDGSRVIHRDGEPDIVQVDSDDQEMNAAIEKARATLPDFIKAVKEAREPALPGKEDNGSYFAVKKPFQAVNGQVEHIWVGDVTYRDGVFTGQMDNEPENIPSLHAGDTVTVKQDEITDWMIVRGGTIIAGGYTIGVLMKREQGR